MGRTRSEYRSLKYRIFEIIQIGNRNDTISFSMDIAIVVNIVVNIICMFLDTFEEMTPYLGAIHTIETVTILFFCIEYGLRFWTAEFLFPKETKGKAKLRYLISFDGVIDLLTILPFFFLSGFVVFRMMRVVRIFHLFRLNNQYDSFHVITSVLYERRNQIISSVFIILILMFASSLCMYGCEHEAQPTIFRNAFSGIWWAMSTLLTVGYGDIYPVTLLGRCMAIVIAFLGVGVVAIPTGIISAGFVEQYAKLKDIGSTATHLKVPFLTITVTEKHELRDKFIRDIHLPMGLNIVVVIRDGKGLIPNKDTRFLPGDQIVIAGENFRNESGIILYNEVITGTHEWANQIVKELDISRFTWLVSIWRKGDRIIPDGDTKIYPGDEILYLNLRLR